MLSLPKEATMIGSVNRASRLAWPINETCLLSIQNGDSAVYGIDCRHLNMHCKYNKIKVYRFDICEYSIFVLGDQKENAK